MTTETWRTDFNPQKFLSHVSLAQLIERMTFEYIEVFYNRIRRHAKINNQIPAQFAQAWQTQQHKNAA